MQRLAHVGALIAAGALGGGCEAEPRALRWTFQVEPAALRERVHAVEAEVLRDGCGGEVSLYRALVRLDERAASPPVLGPGDYGLRGRARDLGCTWFAGGCEEVTLPTESGAIVSVVLGALPLEEAACAPEVCTAGECGVDAGRDEDAGADADAGPPPDAGPRDGGRPPDSGPRDSGPPDAGPLLPPPETFGPGDHVWTVPVGCRRIRVSLWGGGGGGGCDAGADDGRPGLATTFGAARAGGGGGGAHGNASSSYAGGTGGTAVGGDVRVSGEAGEMGDPMTSRGTSGRGGNAPGPGGGLGGAGVRMSAPGNTGGVPGGGGSGAMGAINGAGGGGSGAYVELAMDVAPGMDFAFTVGAGGMGGAVGCSFPGGPGGQGRAVITCE